MRKTMRFASVFMLVITLLFGIEPEVVQGAAGEDLIISSNTTWSSGSYVYEDVTISNNAILTVAGLVSLSCATLTVDTGSSVSADSQGYPCGSGPGAGANVTAAYAPGGGYGGKGGTSQASIAGGGTYGSATEPVDPGSGGGKPPDADIGGAGGGAIRLIVSSILTNNGVITTNGGSGTGNAGGGSGGSLWITTNTLSGIGAFKANGGNGGYGGGGGGGGRIAIYYQSSSFSGTVEAKGGSSTGGGGKNGDAGTAGIFDTVNNDLRVAGYFRFQMEDGPFTFRQVVLANAKASYESSASLSVGDLIMSNGSSLVLTRAEAPEVVLNINAVNVNIDATSTISADGAGYGSSDGPGAGNDAVTQYAGGGGYGGKGGDGQGGVVGGGTYGSATKPVDFGSGGGNDSDDRGGAGGGAVRLVVSNTLSNDGLITANGDNGTNNGGGGSGGSIWVTTGTLAGSGAFRTNGGVCPYGGGGGGGGCIAIYYQSSSFSGALQVEGGICVGGTGKKGEIGTTGLFNTSNNTLHVEKYFRFQEDDGPFNFNQVLLDNDSASFEGAVTVTTRELILSNSSMLFLTNEEAPQGTFTLNTENVTIDSTSTIMLDGRGYPSSTGPGKGTDAVNSIRAGGGGYGGNGGSGQGGFAGGMAYGSADEPTDPGSGGGKAEWGGIALGGAGGGSVRIVAINTFIFNGTITANGDNGTNTAGGGSGGGIWITTSTFAGSGSLSAKGGSSPNGGGGGGGGRIAVYYGTTTFDGDIDVAGGNGYVNGGQGTIKYVQGTFASGQMFEARGAQSDLVETIEARTTMMSDAAVAGGVNGSFNFTELTLVRVTTGSFNGTGFSKGVWEATLDGTFYAGDWKGMAFIGTDNITYLKGVTSGNVTGTIEGTLIGTSSDNCQALWSIATLAGTAISTTANITGTLVYGTGTEYPSTNLYTLQTMIIGSSYGGYNGALTVVLTHIRVNSESNPYYGEGFALMNFTNVNASGEGWAYSRIVTPCKSEITGLFTEPLTGVTTGVLDESTSPRTLSFSIMRLDYGASATPMIATSIVGPKSVDNETWVDFMLQYLNYGSADTGPIEAIITIPDDLLYMLEYSGTLYDPPNVTPLSSQSLSIPESPSYLDVFQIQEDGAISDSVFYPSTHQVVRTLDNIPAQKSEYVSIKVGIPFRPDWETGKEFLFHGYVQDPIIMPEFDPTMTATSEFLQLDENVLEMITHLSCSDGTADVYTIMTIQDAVEHEEPVFSYTENATSICLNYRMTFTASPEHLVDLKQIWDSTGKAKEYVDKYKELKEDIREQKEWEHFINWLRNRGLITNEEYTDLYRQNSGRVCLGLISQQAGKTPVLGDFYSKSIGAIKRTGWKAKVTGLINYHMADRDTDPYQQYIGHKYWGDRSNLTWDDIIATYHKKCSNIKASTTHSAALRRATDPNIKYGPTGHVMPGDTLDYQVEYENVGEGNAFRVYFTDTLHPALDDSTLVIGPVKDVTSGAVIAEPGIYDAATRTITWFAGTVVPHQGGYAEFSVDVDSDTPYGTWITNNGVVYFPNVHEVTPTNVVACIVGPNRIPSIDASPDVSLYQGQPILRYGSFNDPDSGPWTGSVDFGDGSPVEPLTIREDKQFILYHLYNAAGQYNVTLTVTDNESAVGSRTVLISVSPEVEVQVPLKAGWNMVSVPVLPQDTLVTSVFTGTEIVYTWDPVSKSYYVPSDVEPSKGYWVAVMSDKVITVRGVSVYTWTANLTAGWNMIGSIISPADFNDPDDSPDGSVEAFTYWWDPVTKSYIYGNTIESGKGYWVAATRDGTLTLTDP